MSTYAQRYEALTAQRAYARAVAARGIPALMAPYRMAAVSECGRITRVAIPTQRRRSEVSA